MAAPLTGFEVHGSRTTLSEEASLLAQIEAETSATISIIETSQGGHPVRLVELGQGSGSPLMMISLLHGTEPASREAALKQIRDLAYSSDPDVTSYLADNRIIWVPTVNPDGFTSWDRNIPGYGDPNRDAIKLLSPEMKALIRTMKDQAPSLLVDSHEYSAPDRDWLGRPPIAAGIHPEILRVSTELFADIREMLDAQGYTHGMYFPDQSATAGMGMVAGMHHIPVLLSETRINDRTLQQRVQLHSAVMEKARVWHQSNRSHLEQARTDSLNWALTSNGPDTFAVDHVYSGTATLQTVALLGYVAANVPDHVIDIYDLEIGSDGFIPINQESRIVLPHLFEPDSVNKMADAYRVQAADPPPIREDGDIVAAYYYDGHSLRRATPVAYHDGEQVVALS